MIKKIIGAVSLFITFIITFAIGVGCIVRGAGDFSWDIVSQYVSMSDIVMINDSPISNLFSFSDHSAIVGSHAEGRISTPTNGGIIEIRDVPANIALTTSTDEFIYLTFDGNVKESCVASSVANLTGKNIPDIEFAYNDSTDKAVIRFNRLRTDSKEMININIAIPASFKGDINFRDIAGKVQGDFPLNLSKLTIDNATGKVIINSLSAQILDVSDVAGEVALTDGKFGYLKSDDCAGKVTVSGSVGYFDITDIAGNINVESDIDIADDCKISDIMGNVNITLPTGSLVKIKKKDVMGIVIADSSNEAEHTVTISDVMGKISINR